MFKRLARNTLSNGASAAVRTVANFILTPILVLHLGKELYGVWILILSFSVSGTLSLLSLGMQAGLVKYVAEYHALRKWREMNEIISITFYMYTTMGVLGAAGLALFAHHGLTHIFVISSNHQGIAVLMVEIMALQALVELPGLCFDGILGGVQRYDILALLEMLRSVLLCALLASALLAWHSVVLLSWITFSVNFFYSLALLYFAKRNLKEWRLTTKFSRQQVVSVAAITKDLLILRLNGIVYNSMDKYIIASVLTAGLVTDYDIGNRVHMMALLVMGLAGTVVIPAASAAHAKSEHDNIRKLFVSGTKYALALTLPVVCTLFILAPDLIRFWVSNSYANSAVYARLFLSYLFFWSLTAVGWNMLIGVKQTKAIVKIQVISVGANLGFSILLVHFYGVAGVIYGTIIGNLIAFFPYMRLMMRCFGVSLRSFFVDIILSAYPQAALMSAVLLVFTYFRPVSSLYGVAFYSVFAVLLYELLFFVTGVSKEERRQLFSLFARGDRAAASS